MPSNTDNKVIFIMPANKKSAKFFNEDGIKELNAFLKTNLPNICKIEDTMKFYGFTASSKEKIDEYRKRMGISESEPLEFQMYQYPELFKEFNHCFKLVEESFSSFMKILQPERKRDFITAEVIDKFFTEKGIEYKVKGTIQL